MWKYFTSEHNKEFLLSLNLINLNMTPENKLKTLYSLSNNSKKHYIKHVIKKRNGSKRYIYEPDYLLKHVQVNILGNILNNIAISQYAKAYSKGIDILDNVEPHLRKKKILKMDIKNFFPNITFIMVYKYVFKSIYYPPSVKKLLTELCCYDDYLPQGSPTSPMISNIILKAFDEYIGKWCQEQNIDYTRYCDDLTFSGDFSHKLVKKKVESFLNVIGFEVNHLKTRIVTNHKQQIVTGIVVNEKIQVPKNYRKVLRQEIYYINKWGIKNHLKKKNILLFKDEYLESLLGKINYVLHINPYDREFLIGKDIIQKEINHK